jgi:carboxyl-terminal processing protease
MRRRFLLGLVLGVLFGVGWWAGRGSAGSDVYAGLDQFLEVLTKVERNYVEPVDAGTLVDGAVRGMLRSLDPYSQYLDAAGVEGLRSVIEGAFGGIGVVVGIRDQYPTVIAPIEGSPAWSAGLRAGDVIVRIGERSTLGFSVEETAELLRGPEGTRVTFTIARDGVDAPRDVTLERREIELEAVPYAFVLDGGVGYLRLAQFSNKTAGEVRVAVDRLRQDGATRLVLDLRANPGGLLEQAVDVVEQFVPRGRRVVSVEGRARAANQAWLAESEAPELQWPMVVLIDGCSASASEIVAGALQDLDRALVIGRTSFGKGSVQSVFPLKGNRAALKLTTARYHTPSGRSIHAPHAQDSLLADEGLDDEDAVDAPPTDEVPRPEYRTAGGRRVYGGGGITPDVVVAADSLPAVAARAALEGVDVAFANRWIDAHPNLRPGEALGDDAWTALVARLRERHPDLDAASIQASRPWLERSVRIEMARRLGGEAAAARIALAADPVLAKALEVLGRARAPKDVFAAASTAAPRRPSAR